MVNVLVFRWHFFPKTKKNALKEPSRKGPQSRDQRRAEELKIPYTLEEIVDSSVEKLNEMLTTQTLSEAQVIFHLFR